LSTASKTKNTFIDVPCNLCGSSRTKVVYPSTIQSHPNDQLKCECTNAGHGSYYQLVQCEECGLNFSSPRPSKEVLETGYSEVKDEKYEKEKEGRIKTFQRNLRNISKYKSIGKILDVGCSLGVFLSEAKKVGWDAFGIEPSRWCVEQAQKQYSFPIRQGTSDDLKNFNQTFDVVTLWDVLEHVEDPLQTLIDCRDVLNKEGVFVFSTVDFGSLYARLLGKKWPWLMTMHIFYFDKNTIKKYLEKVGLELLEIKVYKHTVSLNYLIYKLNKINRPLAGVVQFLQNTVLFQKNLYCTIGMGDFVEVYTKKKGVVDING